MLQAIININFHHPSSSKPLLLQEIKSILKTSSYWTRIEAKSVIVSELKCKVLNSRDMWLSSLSVNKSD